MGDDFDNTAYQKQKKIVKKINEYDDDIVFIINKSDPIVSLKWFLDWKSKYKYLRFSDRVYKAICINHSPFKENNFSGKELFNIYGSCRWNHISLSDRIYKRILEGIYTWQEENLEYEILSRTPKMASRFLTKKKKEFTLDNNVLWSPKLDIVINKLNALQGDKTYLSLKKDYRRLHTNISKHKKSGNTEKEEFYKKKLDFANAQLMELKKQVYQESLI